jgi:uncharacterized protein YigA (DUF484 family)
LSAPTAEEVARYLQEHPAFFEQYAELLSKIRVPHPHADRAIPLAERQVLGLRDKARALEGKLGELLQFGEENDAISGKVHRLAVALLGAGTLPTLLHELHYHLREDFAIPHTALRLWRGAGEGAEFGAVSAELRGYAAELGEPYCGSSVNAETAGWFGEAGPLVRSVALVPLTELDTTFGMLALGAEEPLRFYPEMGTLYLKRVGDMVSAALLRFI